MCVWVRLIHDGEYSVDQYQADKYDKNYKRTGTQQMHTHAEVAEGCNIILLYYNYGTERGPSKTSTVARLVKAFSFRTGPFMFSDSPSYLPTGLVIAKRIQQIV